jgi:hypothetical protein
MDVGMSFNVFVYMAFTIGRFCPRKTLTHLVRGKNFLVLMDSCLEGHVSNSDGSELIRLASHCLQYEARDELPKKN